jgi:hypothetical protein
MATAMEGLHDMTAPAFRAEAHTDIWVDTN